jgi:hypothetical protein
MGKIEENDAAHPAHRYTTRTSYRAPSMRVEDQATPPSGRELPARRGAAVRAS